MLYVYVCLQARRLLDEEVDVVHNGMGHGELTPEVFTRVWKEPYKGVSLIICMYVQVQDELRIVCACMSESLNLVNICG